MRGFTVYRNPSDLPGKIVVRGFSTDGTSVLKPDRDPMFIADDSPFGVERARRVIRESGTYFCVGRQEGDDSCILETWL